MALFFRTSAFSRVTALAARRQVHTAFAWLHNNPKVLMDWQAELVIIPAPPFGEEARSAWMAESFRKAGLEDIETDELGNVTGLLHATGLPQDSTGPLVVLSAHLDTVFPATTEIKPVLTHADGCYRLEAPSACDNCAGIIGMLALAHVLKSASVELAAPLLFLGNVGEEGEGDLRGVRHFYEQSRYAGRVAAHIVLDGAGAESAVTQALGSRRFEVTVTGPGGHSFTDAGTPNPIMALAGALSTLAETPLAHEARTTLNVGTIRGGTSVNSIPESATVSVDFRSTNTAELTRLEVVLHRAVEDAVGDCNMRAKEKLPRLRGRLNYSIRKIGDRPAAVLAEDSPILEALRAVDRHLGIATELRLGSTDANIPIAHGLPALSLGAGGEGGGAHTVAEWYTDRNRDLGLRRVMLLALTLADWAAEL
ncbi:MAG: M20/M25/M40 family metallo-hydrolase [Acidobacteriota bacterium]|nr:M20/M25/M40 family metallo-hydrolase [Acidobacteriota bacterium]